MKNFWIFIVAIFLSLNVLATKFSNGKQYITLKYPVISELQILEFFSFYCFPCYYFEVVLHITDNIKKKIPENIRITKYHLGSLGPLGKALTRAWAVAVVLGIENKMIIPIYESMQKSQSIQTIDDIRKIFIDNGIKGEDYNIAWNSFLVKSLVARQEKAASDLKLEGVPAVFVGGKYQVNLEGIDASNADTFVQQFTETVQYLVETME